jgi:hypothetical protein
MSNRTGIRCEQARIHMLAVVVTVALMMAACSPATDNSNGPSTATANGTTGSDDSPGNVALRFAGAMITGERETAQSLVVSGQEEALDAMMHGELPPGMSVKPTLKEVTVDGDSATASIEMVVSRDGEEVQRSRQSLTLQRMDGEWRVDVAAEAEEQLREASRAQDATNLKRLVQIWISGVASSKRTPRSTGKGFWLALCVGDGPGDGNLEVSGLDDPDSFVSPRDLAALLASRLDDRAMPPADIEQRLTEIVQAGSGVGGLSAEEIDHMCSYLGPADPGASVRDRTNPIIGCTDEYTTAALGAVVVVTSSAEANWFTREELAADYNWPAGTTTLPVGTAPFEHVTR